MLLHAPQRAEKRQFLPLSVASTVARLAEGGVTVAFSLPGKASGSLGSRPLCFIFLVFFFIFLFLERVHVRLERVHVRIERVHVRLGGMIL
jgi:hypothetical protein